METDDILLVDRFQKGDTKAFALLYDKYIQKIYSFIYYRTHHKQTAEDLTSQTFTKALDKINTFQNTGTFQAWLYQIARNTVIDHYRTAKTEIDITAVFDLEDGQNINLETHAKLQLEQIKNHLKNLNEEHKEVVVLRLWDDLPYKEIAELTGQSEASCKVIVSRALKSIREQVYEY